MNKGNPGDFGFPVFIVKQVCHWQINKPEKQGHYSGD
jgi:hypothetical protein